MNDVADIPRFARFAEFAFHPGTGELFRDGQVGVLPPTAAALLGLLVRRPGVVVTREEIWAAVWPDERIELDQRLNYCVYRLRQELGDDAAKPSLVQTVPRQGYRLLPEVTWDSGSWGRLLDPEPRAQRGDTPPPHSSSPTRGLTIKRWVLAAGLVATVTGIGIARPWFRTLVSDAPEDRAPAEALELGRYLLEGENPDLSRAKAFLEVAAEHTSTRAAAYVSLAAIREEQGDWTAARAFLNEALHQDPRDKGAHLRLGGRALFRDWDWAAAEHHLRMVVESDPTHPMALRFLGHVAAIQGHRAKAAEWATRARLADPAHALSQADAGWIHYWSGDPAKAVETCSTSYDLVGRTGMNAACLFSAALVQGDTLRAASIALEHPDWDHGDQPESPAAVVRRFLRWRLDVLSDAEGADYGRARVLAMLGRPDEALESLLAAARARDPGVPYAGADPLFTALHDDPEFGALVAKVRSGPNRSRETGLSPSPQPAH